MFTPKRWPALCGIVGAIAWLGFVGSDLAGQQAYHVERQNLDSCERYMGDVGATLSWYRHDHHGQMPGSFVALQAWANEQKYPAFQPPQGERYVYRSRQNLEERDPIYWDAEAHHLRGGHGCMVRNGDFRNVVLACGVVEKVTEAEFETKFLVRQPGQ